MSISVICHNPKCGTKFPARRRSALYCSVACRDAAARTRKTGKDKPREKMAICKYCGTRFSVSSKGRPPKFCSDSHRVQWHTGVRTAAVYFLTHPVEGWTGVMTTQRAYDYLEGVANDEIIERWAEWGYRFDGRQFTKSSAQGRLL